MNTAAAASLSRVNGDGVRFTAELSARIIAFQKVYEME